MHSFRVMKKIYIYTLVFILGVLFLPLQSEAQSAEQESVSVHLFPNPSDGIFKIEIELETKEKVTAKIFDMTGKLVKDVSDELSFSGKKITADVSLKDPKPGIHFLRIEYEGRSLTKKIIFR